MPLTVERRMGGFLGEGEILGENWCLGRGGGGQMCDCVS